MNAHLYARVSPRPNVAESESIGNQIAAMRDWLKAHPEYTEAAVHTDRGRSGSDAERPGLLGALSALQPGDVLLVAKRDRLARDVVLAQVYERQITRQLGASVISCAGEASGDDSPMGELMRTILDAFAQWERQVIRLRTSDAMRRYQAQGRVMSSNVIYGYERDPERPGYTRECAAEMAEVRKITALRDQGMSMAGIARELGNTARTGAPWSATQVRRVLKRAG